MYQLPNLLAAAAAGFRLDNCEASNTGTKSSFSFPEVQKEELERNMFQKALNVHVPALMAERYYEIDTHIA